MATRIARRAGAFTVTSVSVLMRTLCGSMSLRSGKSTAAAGASRAVLSVTRDAISAAAPVKSPNRFRAMSPAPANCQKPKPRQLAASAPSASGGFRANGRAAPSANTSLCRATSRRAVRSSGKTTSREHGLSLPAKSVASNFRRESHLYVERPQHRIHAGQFRLDLDNQQCALCSFPTQDVDRSPLATSMKT